MEQEVKETYVTPTVDIVAVKSEGIICASRGDEYTPTPWPSN